MTFRSKTNDVERAVVLEQNDQLRERFRVSSPETFQKLRRCCICLLNTCKDMSACREEFAVWAEQKWNRAVDIELDRRDPQRPYIRTTLCAHDGTPIAEIKPGDRF